MPRDERRSQNNASTIFSSRDPAHWEVINQTTNQSFPAETAPHKAEEAKPYSGQMTSFGNGSFGAVNSTVDNPYSVIPITSFGEIQNVIGGAREDPKRLGSQAVATSNAPTTARDELLSQKHLLNSFANESRVIMPPRDERRSQNNQLPELAGDPLPAPGGYASQGSVPAHQGYNPTYSIHSQYKSEVE